MWCCLGYIVLIFYFTLILDYHNSTAQSVLLYILVSTLFSHISTLVYINYLAAELIRHRIISLSETL